MTAPTIASDATRLFLDRQGVALLVAEHAELLAAARATVAAAACGEQDPLLHLRHALDCHGQLPPAGVAPHTLLAHSSAPTLATCLCASACICCGRSAR
ncbi:hypothetical protein ACIBHX_46640 [Nonomuraea sp. NPDC050536]|uniref:hypothetical protein n=1 Tax=Nonomuraea sp. NPDC050536 TaxID=3364366 RepID=UPI0037CA4EAC